MASTKDFRFFEAPSSFPVLSMIQVISVDFSGVLLHGPQPSISTSLLQLHQSPGEKYVENIHYPDQPHLILLFWELCRCCVKCFNFIEKREKSRWLMGYFYPISWQIHLNFETNTFCNSEKNTKCFNFIKKEREIQKVWWDISIPLAGR